MIKDRFSYVFPLLILLLFIADFAVIFLIFFEYNQLIFISDGVRQESKIHYLQIDRINKSLNKMLDSSHREKEADFLSRSRQYYSTEIGIKKLTLQYDSYDPSTYDFTNSYIYLLSFCYYDLSNDCVGPDITKAGIELKQNETIKSVKIEEIYFMQLNDNPLYFVTVITNLGTKYAIFYPENISKKGLSYYAHLSEYKVLNSSPYHDEVFSVNKNMGEDMIFAHAVRNEDIAGVKYLLKFVQNENGNLNIEWERVQK